jgi:septal ring-binding cell division protein DamX
MKKINLKFAIITFFLTLGFAQSSNAQKESWWKELFKKETVISLEEKNQNTAPEVKTEETPSPQVNNENSIKSQGRTGVVKLHIDPKITALNKQKIESSTLEGYRIQIFFGDLQQARQTRTDFLNRQPEIPCYLVQNAPNFSVLVGNYRNNQEASYAISLLRKDYPSALAVQSKIEYPALPTLP